MKKVCLCCGGSFAAEPVEVAESFWTRLCGLMFRPALAPGAGMLLRNCSGIHCCFMNFSIDAVYLDDGLRVIAVETVRPWRLGGLHTGTRHVLEVAAGRAASLQPGDRLSWKETGESHGQ
jgi:uncharacterized membrane protein (UPF0127 family)